MAKFILSIILSLSFAMALPLSASAKSAVELIENEQPEVSIIVDGSSVRVSGASGMTLYVYNITGMRVLKVDIDSDDKHLDLNLPKGCYILKVGKVVRKISIR